MRSISFLVLFLATNVTHAQDRTGLKTSVAVDLVGEYGTKAGSQANDKFVPRSVEMMFYAPVDHLFDARVSAAAHQEKGQAMFEVHEAYISSDKMVDGVKWRMGQFFLGFGRLNRFHQHEWPFISVPKVQSTFFDNEGLFDSGVEVSYLTPLPFYLDVTAGMSNGYVYGHAHSAGTKPVSPLSWMHLKSFVSLGSLDFQPGISLVQHTASDGTARSLAGFDLTGKLRKGKVLRFFWQSEMWQRSYTAAGGSEEISTGAYFYPQYGFDNGITLGMRVDYLTVNSLRDASGKKVVNSESALVPQLGYRPSEFSNLRLAYRFEQKELQPQAAESNEVVEFQITYMLGAHPAHDF